MGLARVVVSLAGSRVAVGRALGRRVGFSIEHVRILRASAFTESAGAGPTASTPAG